MHGVFERRASGMFVGLGSGETDEQSVFFRREFPPTCRVENVGRALVIAEEWNEYQAQLLASLERRSSQPVFVCGLTLGVRSGLYRLSLG